MERIMSRARQHALANCTTGGDLVRPFGSIALFVKGGRQWVLGHTADSALMTASVQADVAWNRGAWRPR